MPNTIKLTYEKRYVFKNDDGLVKVVPALPTHSRLYVIFNKETSRPVYIGTASNIKDRFDTRRKVLRDVGLSQDVLDDIWVFVIQVKVNGQNKTPGDDGIAGDFDVEKLLIRTYIEKIGWDVRNISKTEAFVNPKPTILSWSLEKGDDFDLDLGINNSKYTLGANEKL